ncbi:putative secretory protein [Phaeoacremonium minimum UCRPA7]|uniref:Putative secretory protein n=1 Tax=Phaeoacremonium minimum (strain UCR-PA7) TaxID=1286976 RepID=R8BJ05_PHAM7|nr:putative secretory protein [Phaeoacremonium minimum UCRPA7]EON99237.1 putative secretory protein [Phaeoacremonium minimum UCRPA7]
MVPFALALQGMVVVAPDYAGLGLGSLPNGERILHAYDASPAQANDVANAMIAARSAFPNLLSTDTPFVTAGHSQGGAIAWAFAERQAVQPIPGYKGTVTFAPPVDGVKLIADGNEAYANNSTEPWVLAARSFIQHSVIAGVTAVYPGFNYTGMTAKVYDRFHNVMAKIQGCLPTDNIVFSDLLPSELGDPSWTSHPTALEFQKRTRVSGKKVAGPFLIIAGKKDGAVPVATVKAAVDDTCAVNANGTAAIEYVMYEGQDHFPVIQASQVYWMQWIKDRLAGKSLRSKVSEGSCTKRTVQEFRTEFNKPYTPPNWLVTQVTDPREVWKYTL